MSFWECVRTCAARGLLTLAYAGLLVIVCLLAWETDAVDLSDLSNTFSVLASALLGVIVNPRQKKQDARVSSMPPDVLWLVAAILAAPAVVLTGVALIVNGPSHPNAATAFAAATAAFAALFVDTSAITHPQDPK